VTYPKHIPLVLFAAVMAISASPLIVRMVDGVEPVAIAFWRCVISASLLAPALRHLKRDAAKAVIFGGAALGIHFWLWFTSLQHTTVVRSTLLVTLSPIWVGIVEVLVFRKKLLRRYWMGVFLALCGVALFSTAPGEGASWKGDLMALIAGQLAALYLLSNNRARVHMPSGTVTAATCAVAAAILLPATFAFGAPLTGYTNSAWFWIAACALGPQLIGHNGFNYALGYVAASTVAPLFLLEPVGAALLAIPVLGEWPTLLEAAGGVVVLVGVHTATKTTT